MRTAIVSGAASGIGREIARTLAKQGTQRLILLDVDTAGLDETAQEIDADVRCQSIDLTDPAAIAATFRTIGDTAGPIDALFNCAGIPAGTPAWPDTPAERIVAIIDLNLKGLILSVQAALPLMRRPGGSILNLASTSGLNPYLTGAIYAASKAGVIMFTRSCAELRESHGIRVNALCPSIVDTPFLQKTGLGGATADWLKDRLAQGSVLTARDVAKAAIALASREDAAGVYEILNPPGTQPGA